VHGMICPITHLERCAEGTSESTQQSSTGGDHAGVRALSRDLNAHRRLKKSCPQSFDGCMYQHPIVSSIPVPAQSGTHHLDSGFANHAGSKSWRQKKQPKTQGYLKSTGHAMDTEIGRVMQHRIEDDHHRDIVAHLASVAVNEIDYHDGAAGIGQWRHSRPQVRRQYDTGACGFDSRQVQELAQSDGAHPLGTTSPSSSRRGSPTSPSIALHHLHKDSHGYPTCQRKPAIMRRHYHKDPNAEISTGSSSPRASSSPCKSTPNISGDTRRLHHGCSWAGSHVRELLQHNVEEESRTASLPNHAGRLGDTDGGPGGGAIGLPCGDDLAHIAGAAGVPTRFPSDRPPQQPKVDTLMDEGDLKLRGAACRMTSAGPDTYSLMSKRSSIGSQSPAGSLGAWSAVASSLNTAIATRRSVPSSATAMGGRHSLGATAGNERTKK